MKQLSNKTLIILSSLTILFLNGCSSHTDIISISEAHPYNNYYGVAQNQRADAIIQEELMAMNEPTQIEMPKISDPTWTTELTMDTDAFYAEDYVQKPEVITYKYKFDKKFYSQAEWRKMP